MSSAYNIVWSLNLYYALLDLKNVQLLALNVNDIISSAFIQLI